MDYIERALNFYGFSKVSEGNFCTEGTDSVQFRGDEIRISLRNSKTVIFNDDLAIVDLFDYLDSHLNFLSSLNSSECYT